MSIIVTKQEYQEFLEHYTWQMLRSPDYRLGQAFLNYFPRIGTAMKNSPSPDIQRHEIMLYYMTESQDAQHIIDMYRDLS
jgi:hypothetical protein